MIVDALPRHDRVALVDAADGRTLTFDGLRRRLDCFADEVHARLGARAPGALAFVSTANRLDDVVALLGLQHAGVAVLPFDASLAQERRAALVERHRPELLVGAVESPGPAGKRIDLDGIDAVLWERGEQLPVAPDVGVCLSTSGSTGSPKLVRLSASGVLANAAAIVAALDISADEVAYAHLPVHYSYGLSVLHSHLLAGSTVVLSSQSALRPDFFEAIRSHGVTTIPHVPFGYQLFERVGFAGLDLPSVHTLTQAGGRLDVALADRYHALITGRGGRFFVMYGQTEATARMSVLPSDEYPALRGSVGRAIPGGAFELVDPDAVGVGHIRYRGPNVMLGYADERAGLARPDELHGVLDTGDAGTLDGDVLTVLGRRGRAAKVLGLRFGLDEVEHEASRLGTVAAVEGDDRLVLFAEGHTAEQCDDLARSLARSLRLPPKAVVVTPVDALPRTPAGKVAYGELARDQ